MPVETGFDIRGIIDNSMLEWENRIAAVVITAGCSLRCPYCHSWRYVTGLSDLPPLPKSSLLDLLRRQRSWIDGVVFTGGEPTLQPELEDMILTVHKMGYAVKLHTNGTRPLVIEKLLKKRTLTTLSLDFKAPLDDRFFPAAGIPNDPEVLASIRYSFRLAAEAGQVNREYHTTLAPSFIGVKEMTDMAQSLEYDGTWILQQFENKDCLDHSLTGAPRYSDSDLEKLYSIAKSAHKHVVLKKGTVG